MMLIFALSGIQAITIGVGLLRSKIVAVAAGPEGLGLISIIDQIAGLVQQVSMLSLPVASVKFFAAAHSESRQIFARGYVVFMRASLLLALLGMSLSLIVVLRWPLLFGTEISQHRQLLALALLSVPATALIILLTNAMAAAQRVRASSIFGLWSAIALLVFSGGGILLAGLKGFYFGNLVANAILVAGAMMYLHLREDLVPHDSRIGFFQEARRYPKVFSFAGALYITSFTTPVAYLVVRYAVLRVSATEGAGMLQAAMGLSMALGAVMRSSVGLFFTPAMNRTTTPTEKLHVASQFQKALVASASVAALPIVLFPHWWVSLLYSRKFLVAAPHIYIFVLAQILMLLTGVNQGLLIGINRILAFILIGLTGDAATACLSWFLAPTYGLGGVAMAFLVSALLCYVLSGWQVRTIDCAAPGGSLEWYALFALVLVGTSGAAARYFGSAPPSMIIAKVAVCIFFAAVSLKTLGGRISGVMQGLRDALNRS